MAQCFTDACEPSTECGKCGKCRQCCWSDQSTACHGWICGDGCYELQRFKSTNEDVAQPEQRVVRWSQDTSWAIGCQPSASNPNPEQGLFTCFAVPKRCSPCARWHVYCLDAYDSDAARCDWPHGSSGTGRHAAPRR